MEKIGKPKKMKFLEVLINYLNKSYLTNVVSLFQKTRKTDNFWENGL
jgi:hypothetical protein